MTGPVDPAAPAGRTRPGRPQPLSPREQMYEDIALAMGPGLTAVNLALVFHHAGLVSAAWTLCPLTLFAVPAAIGIWHRAARPVPPPASPARRRLTRAAAALTLLTAAAAITATSFFCQRHASVSWWDLITPVAVAVGPLLAARNAIRRSQPVPREARPSAGAVVPDRRRVPGA